MEGSDFLLEFVFIINLLCKEIFDFLSIFSSNPLFLCIVSLCVLILIYLPNSFCKIVFSPVPILTWILLLVILRFGAIQRFNSEEEEENLGESESVTNEENREEKQGKTEENVEDDSLDQIFKWVSRNSEEKVKSELGFESSSFLEDSFVEWNVKAPLEVIYEGEETYEETEDVYNKNCVSGILRHSSLSRYYPESDSDSSSENDFPAMENWDSPENMCYKWDEEDREGLIEIALDGCKKKALGFQFEEENMIEIDISPTKRREFSGDDEVFSGEIS